MTQMRVGEASSSSSVFSKANYPTIVTVVLSILCITGTILAFTLGNDLIPGLICSGVSGGLLVLGLIIYGIRRSKLPENGPASGSPNTSQVSSNGSLSQSSSSLTASSVSSSTIAGSPVAGISVRIEIKGTLLATCNDVSLENLNPNMTIFQLKELLLAKAEFRNGMREALKGENNDREPCADDFCIQDKPHQVLSIDRRLKDISLSKVWVRLTPKVFEKTKEVCFHIQMEESSKSYEFSMDGMVDVGDIAYEFERLCGKSGFQFYDPNKKRLLEPNESFYDEILNCEKGKPVVIKWIAKRRVEPSSIAPTSQSSSSATSVSVTSAPSSSSSAATSVGASVGATPSLTSSTTQIVLSTPSSSSVGMPVNSASSLVSTTSISVADARPAIKKFQIEGLGHLNGRWEDNALSLEINPSSTVRDFKIQILRNKEFVDALVNQLKSVNNEREPNIDDFCLQDRPGHDLPLDQCMEGISSSKILVRLSSKVYEKDPFKKIFIDIDGDWDKRVNFQLDKTLTIADALCEFERLFGKSGYQFYPRSGLKPFESTAIIFDCMPGGMGNIWDAKRPVSSAHFLTPFDSSSLTFSSSSSSSSSATAAIGTAHGSASSLTSSQIASSSSISSPVRGESINSESSSTLVISSSSPAKVIEERGESRIVVGQGRGKLGSANFPVIGLTTKSTIEELKYRIIESQEFKERLSSILRENGILREPKVTDIAIQDKPGNDLSDETLIGSTRYVFVRLTSKPYEKNGQTIGFQPISVDYGKERISFQMDKSLSIYDARWEFAYVLHEKMGVQSYRTEGDRSVHTPGVRFYHHSNKSKSFDDGSTIQTVIESYSTGNLWLAKASDD